MYNDDLDYAAIRRRVEVELQQKRFQRQMVLFLLSGFIFVLFVVMLLLALPDATDFVNRDSVLSVVYFLAAGWIVALVFHGLSTFVINSPGWARNMRRRLTVQIIEDLRLDQDAGLAERLTHQNPSPASGRLRLTDEGELLDIIEDSWPDDKSKREERHAK